MARRSVDESQIRSLTRIAGGKSFAITIPMEYIKVLEWEPRQRLIVKLEEGKLIVSEFEEKK